MADYSLDELKAFNGADGSPAYVAFEGTIYDVSESPMWAGGDHEGWHQAGADLTSEQADAPHDVHVTDFPVVGSLR